MNLSIKISFCIPLCFYALLGVSLVNAETSIEEIIVSSDFRQTQLKKIPTGITVIDS